MNGGQDRLMFIRIGAGECAIIVLLVLIVIVGAALAVRLRQQ